MAANVSMQTVALWLTLRPLLPTTTVCKAHVLGSPVFPEREVGKANAPSCRAVPAHYVRLLQVLRDTLRCRLPIEVVYNGKYEMDAPACAHFEVLPPSPA